MSIWMAVLLLSPANPSPPAPASTLEATTNVPSPPPKCLDHSVRELGMSAKKVADERAWLIQPQFLHPSIVPGGSITIRLDGGDVRVSVSWPGSAKEAEIQREIESRVTAMAAKMAQICGVIAPTVKCSLTEPSRPARPCG